MSMRAPKARAEILVSPHLLHRCYAPERVHPIMYYVWNAHASICPLQKRPKFHTSSDEKPQSSVAVEQWRNGVVRTSRSAVAKISLVPTSVFQLCCNNIFSIVNYFFKDLFRTFFKHRNFIRFGVKEIL